MEVTFAKGYSAILKDLLHYLGLRINYSGSGLMVEQSQGQGCPSSSKILYFHLSFHNRKHVHHNTDISLE